MRNRRSVSASASGIALPACHSIDTSQGFSKAQIPAAGSGRVGSEAGPQEAAGAALRHAHDTQGDNSFPPASPLPCKPQGSQLWAVGSRANFLAIVKLQILGSYAHVDIQPSTAPLVQAAALGQAALVTELCEQSSASIACTTQQAEGLKVAALLAACARGRVPVAERLITLGVDANAAGYDALAGMTPLMVASTNGHQEVVSLLLRAGADALKTTTVGDTCMQLVKAAAAGHEPVVQQLLTAGTPVNARCRRHGTALIAACLYNNVDVAATLLAAGADVNARMDLCETGLGGEAGARPKAGGAGAGVPPAVGSLSSVGSEDGAAPAPATVPVPTPAPTPAPVLDALMTACLHASPPLVERLLAAGADVNASDSRGTTALGYAARVGGLQAVRLLLAAGASPDGSSLDPGGPLRKAAQQGHTGVMAALLEAGADPDARGADGLTAAEAADRGVRVLSLADGTRGWVPAKPSTVQAVRHLLEEASAKKKRRQDRVKARRATGRKEPSSRSVSATTQSQVQAQASSSSNSFGQPRGQAQASSSSSGGSSFGRPRGPALASNGVSGEQQSLGSREAEVEELGSSYIGGKCILGSMDMAICRPPDHQSEGVPSTVRQLGVAMWGLIFQGNVTGVKWLLEAGCDANTRNDDSSTPLMLACWLGLCEIASELCASGADVNAHNVHGATALSTASCREDAELVRTLIHAGARVDAVHGGSVNVFNPLLVASVAGHHAVVTELIAAGADAQAVMPSGETYLMHAAVCGHLGVVQALLAAGADVLVEDKKGQTALVLACNASRVDVVDALLAAGALRRAPSIEGHHALMGACLGRSPSLPVVERLLAEGAPVSCTGVPGLAGTTPLAFAAQRGSLAVVRRLLEAGAAVDGTDAAHSMPLRLAAQQGHPDVVAALLEAGADPDLADEHGCTALDFLAHGAFPVADSLSGFDTTVAVPLKPAVARKVRSLLEEAIARKRRRQALASRARPAGKVHARSQQTCSQDWQSREEADRIGAELLAQEERDKQAAAAKASKKAMAEKRAERKAGASRGEQGGGSGAGEDTVDTDQGAQGAGFAVDALAAPSASQLASMTMPEPVARQVAARILSVQGLSLLSKQQQQQHTPITLQPLQPLQPLQSLQQQQHTQLTVTPWQLHHAQATVQPLQPPPPPPRHSPEDTSCVVCMEGRRTVVLVPCGHVVLCGRCCENIQQRSNECPVCREPIDAAVSMRL